MFFHWFDREGALTGSHWLYLFLCTWTPPTCQQSVLNQYVLFVTSAPTCIGPPLTACMVPRHPLIQLLPRPSHLTDWYPAPHSLYGPPSPTDTVTAPPLSACTVPLLHLPLPSLSPSPSSLSIPYHRSINKSGFASPVHQQKSENLISFPVNIPFLDYSWSYPFHIAFTKQYFVPCNDPSPRHRRCSVCLLLCTCNALC